MTGEVSRAEFDGSIQSIRREIQLMGENLDKRLDHLIDLVGDMSKSTSEDSKKIAILRVQVEALQDWKAGAQILNRGLIIGLVVSFAAQIMQIATRR